MANYVSKVIYGGRTLIDLTADTIKPEFLLAGYTAHDASGAPVTGTCDFDVNSQDATAVASEILVGKTAYVKGAKVEGTMKNNGAVSGVISAVAEEYTVPQGFHDGSGKVKIAEAEQAKLIAENIREGVTVLGVTGTMSGTEDAVAQSVEVTPGLEAQEILPDTTQGYNYLASVTVKAIPYDEVENSAGGLTVTIG